MSTQLIIPDEVRSWCFCHCAPAPGLTSQLAISSWADGGWGGTCCGQGCALLQVVGVVQTEASVQI